MRRAPLAAAPSRAVSFTTFDIQAIQFADSESEEPRRKIQVLVLWAIGTGVSSCSSMSELDSKMPDR